MRSFDFDRQRRPSLRMTPHTKRATLTSHALCAGSKSRGMTLVETLVVVGILAISLGAIFTYINLVLKSQNTNIKKLIAQSNARYTFKMLSQELRGAQYAETGTYPIEKAEQSQLIFYSDMDNDNRVERLRYFLENNELKRGKTEPEGQPPKYLAASEKITILVENVQMSGEPVFKYYDGTYTGAEAAMSYPINLGQVRLIYMNVIINPNPNRMPSLKVETEITLRNLKDNL